MTLLAIPVLVGASRIGCFRFHSIMTQQRPVTWRVHFGIPIPVDRQRRAVRAMPPRRPAQSPPGVLRPLGQARETLRKTQTHVLPVRVGQHEVVHQVRERLALNRHPQFVHVREVRGTQPARFMHLGEEHFLGRTVPPAPLPHAPLQRPPHTSPVPLRVFPLQPLPQRLGLQGRLPLQQFLQAGPHGGQRIGTRPPRMRLAHLLGQLARLAILPGRLAIHAALQRCLGQRSSSVQALPQLFDLGRSHLPAGSHR